MCTRSRQLSLLLLVVAAATVPAACHVDLQKLAPIVNQMIDDRSLLESFVHDVKKEYQPGAPAYEEMRMLYAQARATQEAYLTAIQVAADTSDEKATLSPIIGEAQQRSTAFVSRGVSLLSPPGSRAVVPATVITLPDLHGVLAQFPKQYRTAAMQELERQVRWRPWDDI